MKDGVYGRVFEGKANQGFGRRSRRKYLSIFL